MAPKRTNKRLNIPGNRTPATYDLKNQEHFNQFKRAGFIPPEYESYAQLQDAFLELVYQGASDKDAAEALGVDYRNVIGKGYLAAELSSKGIPRGISARTLREDIKPDEKAYLINRFGEDWFKDYERYRKLEWGDTKVLKKDQEIVERFSGRPVEEFTSAKQEADVLRDRLVAAFGKGGRGGQVHRGHGVSAMEGASVGKSNLVGEWGPLNVGHGSDPRYDYNVMRNLNMSATDLQNYYDNLLEQEGLTINPRRYAGNYVAADEALRELKQGTSIGNPEVTIPVEPTSVDPRSIEWRDRRLFEIEQQLAAEYERSGMAPNEAALKARQRVEEAALNQSTLFNVTQSRGGPTATVQQAMPKPRQIGTVVGEQQFDPFGRPKLDRSGEPKFETREIYEPPSGVILSRFDKGIPAATKPQTPTPKQVRTQADIDRIFGSVGGPETIEVSGNYIPKPPLRTTPTAKERALAAERANAGKFKEMARGTGPTPVVTPSQSLGQRAAAIVNREPLPQPKPVSQPKVGQPAILNGQSVVWSGNSWVRVPTPKALASSTKPSTGRRGAAPRTPTSSTTRTRSQSTQYSWDNPLSPINRGSAVYGGTERRTNEAVQDAPGWSPFWLKLAD